MRDAKEIAVERIYLLLGAGNEGETLWCDDPTPGVEMREEDAVEYVRADVHAAALIAARNEALEGAAKRADAMNATHAYIGLNEAGEVRSMIMDDPAHQLDTAEVIAEWLRMGRKVRKVTKEKAIEMMREKGAAP